MTYSTTITSKGQITLPADLRAKLKLLPGKKVSVRLQGNHLIIDAPVDLEDLRKRNQAWIKKQGISHIPDDAIDTVWAQAAIERYRRSLEQ